MLLRYTQIALLIAMSSILSSLENLVPTPLPFVRLGLANIATILAIQWWGGREVFFIVLMRVMISSLIVGKFLQPSFFLSLSGGMAAALVMIVVFRFCARWFGLVGISILGALTHNMVQTIVAYFLFIHQIHIFSLFPLLILSSLFSGILIGLIAIVLIQKLSMHMGNCSK